MRRLEELRVLALEERVEADLERGEHALLASELEALVAEHPLRERLRGQQMRALYRLGRQADALATYRDLRDPPGRGARPRARPGAARARAGDPHPPGPAPRRRRSRARRRRRSAARTTCAGSASCCDAGDVRLLTLTGPGGVGKTRLALELARTLDGRFVSLAAVGDAEQVAPAIGDALDIARVPGEAAEDALQRALAGERSLLVLDNLEHLPGVEAIVARLLARATVLATSRQPLGLQAEHRYPVAPLAERAAIRLFESRAAARGFALSDADRPAVEELCRRLGGHPLAIELAAARLGVLDPAGLAARLEDALSLLGPGPSDAPARQRTLRATMDWSYGLLSERERDAFTAFGAFAADCALDAAEAVTRRGAAGPRRARRQEPRQRERRPAGDARAGPPVRRRAARAAAGRRRRARPARSTTTRRSPSGPGASSGPAGARRRSFEALHRERGNFRAALTWAGASAAGVRLAGALDFYWWAANAEAEAQTAYERALNPVPEDADAADVARARLGWARRLQPDSPSALAQATRGAGASTARWATRRAWRRRCCG